VVFVSVISELTERYCFFGDTKLGAPPIYPMTRPYTTGRFEGAYQEVNYIKVVPEKAKNIGGDDKSKAE
jgi:hypothetical protein